MGLGLGLGLVLGFRLGLHDDHYLPAMPQLYHQQRLLRLMEFYENKLLPAQRCRNTMHVFLLIFGVMSGIFAYFDKGPLW